MSRLLLQSGQGRSGAATRVPAAICLRTSSMATSTRGRLAQYQCSIHCTRKLAGAPAHRVDRPRLSPRRTLTVGENER